MAAPENLTSVLQSMDDKTQDDKLTLGDIVDSFGSRGFGPLILAAVLIELLPTGGIPGIPTLVATTIIILASQMVAGRSSPWMPQKLRNKGFACSKFKKARDKVVPVTQRIDRVLKPRLYGLTTPLAAKGVGVAIILVALTMPPLELIPFTGYFPAVAIALMALGLTGRDGLMILLGAGFALTSIAAGLVLLLR